MDVVLFRYRGKHVLHRIICREGERLLIQGDGSIVAKEECTVDDVVGKVVQICRPSGKEIPVGSWQWTWSIALVCELVMLSYALWGCRIKDAECLD